jgi:hypothetical protein
MCGVYNTQVTPFYEIGLRDQSQNLLLDCACDHIF